MTQVLRDELVAMYQKEIAKLAEAQGRLEEHLDTLAREMQVRHARALPWLSYLFPNVVLWAHIFTSVCRVAICPNHHKHTLYLYIPAGMWSACCWVGRFTWWRAAALQATVPDADARAAGRPTTRAGRG